MFDRCLLVSAVLFSVLATELAAEDNKAGYEQASAVLRKYCQGCHNADDREGDLSIESFTQLQRGGELGRSFIPGDAKSSRLIRVLTGAAKPAMPPEDNEKPSEAEIQILRDWINAGARGPEGAEPAMDLLRTPQIASRSERRAISDIVASPDGRWLAIARFSSIDLLDAKSGKAVHKLTSHPGKVNSIRFSQDSKSLVAATGVSGLYGLAQVWDVKSGKKGRTFKGHRDVVFSAVLSPDGKIVATASYDRMIMLWDAATGKQLRVLRGHNDAVYDLDFNSDGTVLASASGDETIKLWRVTDGERLDTLGQPQGEQYVVRFSPDGRHVVGGGVDNRIRVWRFTSKTKRQINPLIYARFAHEAPIVALEFSRDGGQLLSAAEDLSLKAWITPDYVQIYNYARQPDVISGIAVTDGDAFTVARMDGSTATSKWIVPNQANRAVQVEENHAAVDVSEMNQVKEAEPNADDMPQLVSAPATIAGVVNAAGGEPDVDVFCISAKKGQRWVMEVNAARSKSQLDSYLQILDAKGQPIPRVKLQAVRDSYFTFRGKDSNTSNDFRLHNWEEMELNEYLYCKGEVVKLWMYPRGPDSGFKVYPGTGNRYGFFGTSPTAHALQEPCYIVEPHHPQATVHPNGLPVFTLYYENDDDARRKLGADSRVNFVAPYDGDFLVRLTDVRGHGGEDFKYTLNIRPSRPDFKVTMSGLNPTVTAGGGREFSVKVDRIDGFDGEVQVHIGGLPPGFHATSPLTVQAGQNVALGVIHCDPDAAKPTPENAKSSVAHAVATIDGKDVERPLTGLGEIKLAPKAKVVVRLAPLDKNAEPNAPLEITIRPGETVKARVVATRDGFGGIISFGKEDSGRNLPHGVFVDNIGLNGLMLRAGQNERIFFITAAKWVPETSCSFHLVAGVEGKQTTQPVMIHVRKPKH